MYQVFKKNWNMYKLARVPITLILNIFIFNIYIVYSTLQTSFCLKNQEKFVLPVIIQMQEIWPEVGIDVVFFPHIY